MGNWTSNEGDTTMSSRTRHISLWTTQSLLAALFIFAGVMKLTMPAAALAQVTGLPGWFMRFISAAEIAGGLGLVLPGVFRIRRVLTPLAAAGLVGIMAGAVVLSALRLGATAAIMPLVVGVVLTIVVRGRRDWARVQSSRA
jgi:uncharacterized membrane protein YphA (DoxX/SURF4 family)